jgi:alkylation response protein AidB-like acyl-CoA dehydrogenase
MPIIIAGNDAQKREWLTHCASEFSLISFCLSEPDAGSDVAGLQLLAEKDGSDYVLSGTKCWISNGGEADLYTVFATLDRSSRHQGICAFIVPADLPGISLGKKEDKLGQRARNTCSIHFDGVRIPASQRLGAEGEGFKIAMRTLDRTRPPIAALATGIARRPDESTVYALERKAFGSPIGSFRRSIMLAIKTSRRAAVDLQSDWMVDRGRAENLDRQVLCDRRGDAHHDRRRPDLRRQRLHEGLPRREADARRQADADLRGHNQIQRLVMP